jgi:glycosyltransferase involved in cell wall biosynthesis
LSAALTVLMPVYNGESTVGAAVSSTLSQSFSDFQLVLVDDGSTDATVSAAQSAAGGDPRLRVLLGPHAGIVAALNRGLAAIETPLIARMDANDTHAARATSAAG